MIRAPGAVAVGLWAAASGMPGVGVAQAGGSAVDGLEVARAYADAMLARGRDVYGPVHSPLFASALDRRTMRTFHDRPGTLPGIRETDRSWRASNPMHDRELYQLLYSLSEATRDARYAREADAALAWFYRNAQGPKGLYAWGEHLSWDLVLEQPFDPRAATGASAPAYIHEFFGRWDLLEGMWRLAPDAARRFARGLWEHQIGDHELGLFSRHAYDVFDPENESARTGNEFPVHGGHYIHVWAEAYRRTGDPEMLRAIEVLVDGFIARRHPVTRALPSQTAIPELHWPQSAMQLAIALHDAAPGLPDPLRSKMLDLAVSIDEAFHRLPHDPGGRGFVKSARTSTLEPGDVRAERDPQRAATLGRRWGTHTTLWETGYGVTTTGGFAVKYILPRYRQTGDPRLRRQLLAAADRYLDFDPLDALQENPAAVVYPDALAGVVELMLAAHEITSDRRYLEPARRVGRAAHHIFFDDLSPLPKASSRHPWYETITGGDDLVLQLLHLWNAHRPRPSGG